MLQSDLIPYGLSSRSPYHTWRSVLCSFSHLLVTRQESSIHQLRQSGVYSESRLQSLE